MDCCDKAGVILNRFEAHLHGFGSDRTLLPAIAAFSQVAREGSFTRAAAVMGVSPSALSQTLRMLEQRLDVRLLNRSTRSISLTEEGRHLLQQIDPGLSLIDQAVTAVGTDRNRPTGEIRINTSRAASRCFIEPHLAEFGRRYPLIRLELIMDDGLGDIVHAGCDAGIRLRESVSESMIAVPICPDIEMAVVGSPAYFETHPVPETPADLAGHNCVRFRHASSGAIYRWEFTDPVRPQRDLEIEPRGTFTTNR
jgi:DNA-binding transcriptional LysR family regulator